MACRRWVGEQPGPVAQFRMEPRWVAAFLSSLLLGRQRSFAADSRHLRSFVRPEPAVEDTHFIPPRGSFVVVTNHYYRLGYNMWWGMATVGEAISLSRGSPTEVTWIVANRWTYPDRLRQHVVTPLSLIVFRRLARMYGFISMPPMPPHPEWTAEAVQAIRRTLSVAASATEESPVILGLAPEGGDSPDGRLVLPPAGVGRFIAHLTRRGLGFVPVGVFEENGRLTARFGPPFVPAVEDSAAHTETDRQVADQVMGTIARLVPERLRGPWASEPTVRVGSGTGEG